MKTCNLQPATNNRCPCGQLAERGPLCGQCWFQSPGHLRHTYEHGNPKRRAQTISALTDWARKQLRRQYLSR